MTVTKSCLFCRIISREHEGLIIYEDDDFMAFLDKHPVFLGHSLLVPKRHAGDFYELPQNALKPFFHLAQRLGRAIETAMHAEGSFMGMNNTVSQSIPHLHLHIIPRNFHDQLHGFFWPRVTYTSAKQAIDIQKKIIKALKTIE